MSSNVPLPSLFSDPVGTLVRGLLDDASLFPPGSLPMPAAIAAHSRHAAAWYADLAGPFVCPETRLAELGRALTAAGTAWIELCLVVTGGASAVPAAVDAVAADPRLWLRAIEVPAAKGDEPGRAIGAVATALDRVPLAGATAYIEFPLSFLAGPARAGHDGTGPLLEIADGRGYRPKLRTGGVTADAFPDEATLAACLTAVAGQRIPFKCTAGLHHAVRHTAADTGFEHHGFLNVLLAVGAAAGGASAAAVAGILAERDPSHVACQVQALDLQAAEEIRWLFGSFGTCSTDEPVADLVGLGLASRP